MMVVEPPEKSRVSTCSHLYCVYTSKNTFLVIVHLPVLVIQLSMGLWLFEHYVWLN
jgi:hypothetical protein